MNGSKTTAVYCYELHAIEIMSALIFIQMNCWGLDFLFIYAYVDVSEAPSFEKNVMQLTQHNSFNAFLVVFHGMLVFRVFIG